MRQDSQHYVQKMAASRSTGSLHNNRSTASLASAASIISDSSGAPAVVPHRSGGTASGGESLQPCLTSSVTPRSHQFNQPISAGPNVTFNTSHPSAAWSSAPAAGGNTSQAGVLQSHSQGTVPAGHKSQYMTGTQQLQQPVPQNRVSYHTMVQTPPPPQPGPTSVSCAPRYCPVEAQPIWVIEEVVDFGVPMVEDLDQTGFLKEMHCFTQLTSAEKNELRKGQQSSHGGDGMFATCLKPSCKAPELCPIDA